MLQHQNNWKPPEIGCSSWIISLLWRVLIHFDVTFYHNVRSNKNNEWVRETAMQKPIKLIWNATMDKMSVSKMWRYWWLIPATEWGGEGVG